MNNDFIQLEAKDGMSIILQIWANFYVISLEVLTKKKQITRMVCQDLWSPGILKILANYPNQRHIHNPGLVKHLLCSALRSSQRL